MMDILRDGKIDDNIYFTICKKCVEENDVRFRIKNKINHISNSVLKEQNGYDISRVVFIFNEKTANLSYFINPIKYFSFLYDEIIIQGDFNFNFNDPTIIILNSNSIIDPKMTFIKKYDFTNKIMDIHDICKELNITADIQEKYFQ